MSVRSVDAMGRMPGAMTKEDAAYFQRRAEAELELAQVADHPAAVKAHYLLANHYLDELFELAPEDAEAPVPHG